jgi:hypothetical protein
MQTALVPEHDTPSPPPHTSLLPLTAPQPGTHGADGLNTHLSSLLKQAPASAAERSPVLNAEEQIAPPGLFLGLRVALLFNVALGVTGFAAYELWTAFFH